MPAVWPQRQSEVHNQIVQTRRFVPPTERAKMPDLYRRYDSLWKHPGGVQSSSGGSTITIRSTGRGGKRQKIRLQTSNDGGLLGFHAGQRQHDDFSTPEQDQKRQKRGSQIFESTGLIPSPTGFYPGQDQFSSGRVVSRQGSHGFSSPIQSGLTQTSQRVGPLVFSSDSSMQGGQMVARSSLGDERQVAYSSPCGHPDGYGCFGSRVGSLDREQTPSGQTGSDGGLFRQNHCTNAHQLQGVDSGQVRLAELQRAAQEQGHRSSYGQHDHPVLHKPNGGPQFQASVFSRKNMGYLPQNARNNFCDSYCRCAQQSCGRIEQETAAHFGSAPQPQVLQNAGQGLGPTLNRSVCLSGGQADGSLRELDAQSQLGVGRLDGTSLDGGERLGQPTLLSHRPSAATKSAQRGLNDYVGGPLLDGPTMVHVAGGAHGGRSENSSSVSFGLSQNGRTTNEIANLGHSRMADIRQALRAEGVSEETINNLEKSWEKSTLEGYESIWKKWSSFAAENGIDRLHPSQLQFDAWLSSSVDSGAKEGSLEKYKSVVGSTLALMNPGLQFTSSLVASRLTKAAAKVNGSKQRKYNNVFDISYLFQYIAELDGPDTFKSLTERVILLMKCLTGWRAADVAGVTIKYGIRRVEHGVYLRSWDSKKKKQAWTSWTFVAERPATYWKICLVHFLDVLLEEHKKFTAESVKVDAGEDVPLFVSAGKGLRKPLVASTVSTKFDKELLANLKDGDAADAPSLSKVYGQHASRHAVASYLAMMKVPPVDIARHMATTAESVSKSYIVEVHRDWEIPACINLTNDLSTKLVLPYIHYESKGKVSAGCACGQVISKIQAAGLASSAPPPSLSNLQSPSSERSGI